MRKERGWTQVELGEILGISRQSIHSLETGKFDPALPLAFRIADVFGMPIEEIFRHSSESTPPSARSDTRKL